jgi:hypothetical protein
MSTGPVTSPITRRVLPGEVDAWGRYECGKAGDEVRWGDHYVCGAVAKRVLEVVDDLPDGISVLPIGELLIGDSEDHIHVGLCNRGVSPLRVRWLSATDT